MNITQLIRNLDAFGGINNQRYVLLLCYWSHSCLQRTAALISGEVITCSMLCTTVICQLLLEDVYLPYLAAVSDGHYAYLVHRVWASR